MAAQHGEYEPVASSSSSSRYTSGSRGPPPMNSRSSGYGRAGGGGGGGGGYGGPPRSRPGYMGGSSLGAKMAEAAAAQRHAQQHGHGASSSPMPSASSPSGRHGYSPPLPASPYQSNGPSWSGSHPHPPTSAPLPPTMPPPPPPPPSDAPPPPPPEAHPSQITLDPVTTPLSKDGSPTKGQQERMNYFCKYDPMLDSSVVKKGGAPVYRYSKPPTTISSKPNRDPRLALAVPLPLSAPPTTAESRRHLHAGLIQASKGRMTFRPSVEAIPSYPWDQNSVGPAPRPPATALFISSLDRLVTSDQVRTYFSQYGRVAECELRLDPHTGGSLGLCWLRFADDLAGRARVNGSYGQDGHACAQEAAKRANGARIGIMLSDGLNKGIRCELDGEGKKCRKATEAEILRRHPPTPAPPASEPLPNGVPTSRAGNGKAPTVGSSTNPSASPASTSATSHPPATEPQPVAVDPLQAFRDQQAALAKQAAAAGLVPTMPAAMRNQLAAQQAGMSAEDQAALGNPQPAPTSASAQGFFGGAAPRQGPQLLKKPNNLASKLPILLEGSFRAQPPIRSKIAAGFIAAAQQAAIAAARAQGMDVPAHPIEILPPFSLKGKEKAAEEEAAAAVAVAAAAAAESDDESEESEDEDARAEREKEEEREALIRARKGSAGKPGVAKLSRFTDRTSPTARSAEKGAGEADVDRPASESPVKEKAPLALKPGVDQKRQLDAFRRLANNGRPYVTIDRSYLGALEMGPSPRYGPMELKRHFYLHRPEQVFTDSLVWYITFYSADNAPRAHQDLNKQPFMGFPIPMQTHDPISKDAFNALLYEVSPSSAPPPPTPVTAAPSGPMVDGEMVRQARRIILNDLRTALAKDLRTRIVTAKVWDILRDEEKRALSPSTQRRTPSAAPERASATPAPVQTSGETGGALKLPSFAKRRPAIDRYVPNYEDRSGPPRRRRFEEDSASVASSDPPRRSLAPQDASDDDGPLELPAPAMGKGARKKKPSRKLAIAWSSEEESEPGEPARLNGRPTAVEEEAPGKGKPAKVKKAGARGRDELDELTGAPLTPLQLDEFKARPVLGPALVNLKRDISVLDGAENEAPAVNKRPRVSKPPQRVWHGPAPDPFAHRVAEDEEDLYYAQLALKRLRDEGDLHPEPKEDEDDEPEVAPGTTPHISGAARAEGYYTVSTAQKAAYLPQRNKAIVDVAGANSALAVSRSARVNTRRFVVDMQQQKKAADNDVVKFNQLRTRKKQLHFARSPIHDWGLYAMEMVPVGEMVIEYVGEVIRQVVADRREKAYERVGIGSSYLFRVDDDLVVDATKKGNLGRLINHCCTPNCTAKIITINGEKKIVIYAKTTIEPGDEVTYDYHFPKEDTKIPCLCGSVRCKGTLN